MLAQANEVFAKHALATVPKRNMTGKERLVRASLGLEVDRVPWAPMLYQWFHANSYNGTLPDELSECKSCLDAGRVMQADLFAKHEAFVVYASYSDCLYQSSFSGKELRQPSVRTCLMDVFGPGGNVDFDGHIERHDQIITPKGELRACWVYNEIAGAPYEKKNLWTNFEDEYKIVRSLLEDLEFVCDTNRWEKTIARLGNDGIAHFRIPPTPLKILHWLTGPENTIYFMNDHPDKIMELVRIYESKRLTLIKKIVSIPEALVFTSGDNMDSMMYSPSIFEDYCGRSFRQIAEVLHSEGKLLFTHACGQLTDVIGLCADSGVDGMEGMAPPPLGDLDFSKGRALLGPKFVIQGGMTLVEEEMNGTDTRERIFARVKEILSSIPDKRAFIFGSGCSPGPRAKYENLLALRDACWRYGRF